MDKKDVTLQVAKWYALRTYHKHERRVGKILKLDGVKVYIPQGKIRRRWSDRVKVMDTSLLGSVVLVYCSELRLKSLSATKGVIDIIGDERGPVEIAPSVIEALQEFSKLAEGAFMVDEDVFDRVMVVSWTKRAGEVVMVDDTHYYLSVPELGMTLYIEK